MELLGIAALSILGLVLFCVFARYIFGIGALLLGIGWILAVGSVYGSSILAFIVCGVLPAFIPFFIGWTLLFNYD